jgi:hypothetical protein
MTTYRLPEVLGGAEAELIQWNDKHYPSFASLDIGGVVVIVPQEHLTEVKPPLPPEPEKPAYVVDRTEHVWQRRRTGWQCITGGQQSWADLWRDFGPLSRLVPDPFAEPVELPWRLRGVEVRQGVHSDGGPGGLVAIRRPGGGASAQALAPCEAREMARALWAAADAAEATP